jgi:foldase protein PrsA
MLMAGCQASSDTGPGTAATTPAIVATVNDRPISTRLYEMYLKNGQEALGLDQSTDDGKRKLELLREGIVSELIDRILIAQEAERRGLSLSTEEMQQAEERTSAQFGGEKQYDEYLARHRLSREEYREVIRWELYGGKLRAELAKEIPLTDDDVKRYYDEHKGDAALQLPERVTASHILIAARPNLVRAELEREHKLAGEALEKGVQEEMSRRRARAAELRRKAQAGADFSQLAREFSEDPSSREQGGDLGTFTRDSHPKAFDDAAFALKPGALSQVVQTDFGYHIIKVSAHDEARPKTLAEATPEIRQRLMSERLAVHLKEWLAQARRNAFVRINEAFRFGSLRQEFPAM